MQTAERHSPQTDLPLSTWHALILQRRTPRWVPASAAHLFAQAHGSGCEVSLTPEQVFVDLPACRLVHPGFVPARTVPEDLATCLAALLETAVRHPHAARHAFQQTALLWRAYREERGLPPNGAFEQELVRAIGHKLRANLTDLGRPRRRVWPAPEPATLHEFVDALHRLIRDGFGGS